MYSAFPLATRYLMDQGLAEQTLWEHKEETAIDGSLRPLHAGGNSCLFASLPRRNHTMKTPTLHRGRQSKWFSTEKKECEKDSSQLEQKKVEDLFWKTPMTSARIRQHGDEKDVAHAWNDDATTLWMR